MTQHTFFLRVSPLLLAVSTFCGPQVNAAEPQTVLSQLHKVNEIIVSGADTGLMKACWAESVKYAGKLKKDHVINDNTIVGLAVGSGAVSAEIPSGPWIDGIDQIERQRRHLTELKSLRDCDFDQEFLTDMKDTHVVMIKLIAEAMDREQDPEIRDYLKATERKEKKHLSEIDTLLLNLRPIPFKMPYEIESPSKSTDDYPR